MKKFVFFILCAAYFFAYYPDPPLATIIEENAAIAVALNNSFNETNAKSADMTIFGQRLQTKGNMAIAGLSPLVDNTTNGTLAVIIEKGSESDDFSRADVDGDGCIEEQKQKGAYYNITVEFRLNETMEAATAPTKDETIGAKTYASAIQNTINATPGIAEKIYNASGNETLEIRLNGSITFVYLIDDKEKIFDGSCITNEKIFESTLNFEDIRSIFAAGGNKLFFLIKPVLSEHWYRDEEISWLLFSQRKIYKIEINATGSENVGNKKIGLYDFDVVDNEWGIKEIISIENDASSFIGRAVMMPTPISEKNTAFSYLYKANYTDDLELGKKNFTIKATDVFSGEEKKEYAIYSRQLSLGGKTETGTPPAWETTRKNIAAVPQETRTSQLLFGALGIVIIIMLLRFQLK